MRLSVLAPVKVELRLSLLASLAMAKRGGEGVRYQAMPVGKLSKEVPLHLSMSSSEALRFCVYEGEEEAKRERK